MAVDPGKNGFIQPGEPYSVWEGESGTTWALSDTSKGDDTVSWWKQIPTALSGLGNAVGAIFGMGGKQNDSSVPTEQKLQQLQQQNEETENQLEQYKTYLYIAAAGIGVYIISEEL